MGHQDRLNPELGTTQFCAKLLICKDLAERGIRSPGTAFDSTFDIFHSQKPGELHQSLVTRL
jgi:hypothetical protein